MTQTQCVVSETQCVVTRTLCIMNETHRHRALTDRLSALAPYPAAGGKS